jgi:hypothetical protein
MYPVWSRFRSLVQRLSTVSLFSLGLLGVTAAPSLPLDRISLRPTFLLEEPLPFEELEAFALEGRKSSDIQFLLDLVIGSSDLQEQDLQQFLGNVSEVNGEFVDRFLTSAIGEVLVQELIRVIQADPKTSDNPEIAETWKAMQAAMIAAAADDRSSVIEVLQNYQPEELVLDVSRVGKLQSRVKKEVKEMQDLLGIAQSGNFNAGVSELFCAQSGLDNLAIGNSNVKAKELFDLLFTFTASGEGSIDDVFSEPIPIDPKLANLFLKSYFGEIFLRHLALNLSSNEEPTTIAALKEAISGAVQDGAFSINEALEQYQPQQQDANRAELMETVTRIRNDIRDYQAILGIEGTEDINNVIRTIVCESSSTQTVTAPATETEPN